ncbi:MAG: three-Cys-motif partner protein TcmP [Planctomycetes bacterium]|nr:three-Cys-motif partner protein TcmP [Planctomycetota bacterium]
MTTEKFFDEIKEQSQVKAAIVEKYFDAWAAIIIGAQKRFRPNGDNRIGYVDLFAGPGRYKDGSASTPLRVLQMAIEKSEYAERLVTVLNDKDDGSVKSLQESIAKLDGIKKLKHPPQIWNQEVGDKIAQGFAQIKKFPILAFIDPWGYKGLTLKLVDSFLKDWGCDCIFFFNYARINAGLSNPFVHEHMCSLFGAARAGKLQVELEPLSPGDRELMIVNELAAALKGFGHRFVLPFRFRNEEGTRTTHHLILVTKDFKGYEVMKDIMAKESSKQEQGVPSFEFNLADKRFPTLFELNCPLDDLKGMILSDFNGKTAGVRAVYESHSVDKPFILRNYKDVLKQLEAEGKVSIDPPASKRRKHKGEVTLKDEAVVTFPMEGG